MRANQCSLFFIETKYSNVFHHIKPCHFLDSSNILKYLSIPVVIYMKNINKNTQLMIPPPGCRWPTQNSFSTHFCFPTHQMSITVLEHYRSYFRNNYTRMVGDLGICTSCSACCTLVSQIRMFYCSLNCNFLWLGIVCDGNEKQQWVGDCFGCKCTDRVTQKLIFILFL